MMHKTHFPGLSSTSVCFALLLALALAGKSVAADALNPDVLEKSETVDVIVPPEDGRSRLTELNLLSEALVEKAGTGNSPAHQFRIEARMYRELLRRLMLENREISSDQQISKNLLLEMVRMSALLHSAADCKTGLVITCPPDLMLQLKSQQARIDQELKLNRLP